MLDDYLKSSALLYVNGEGQWEMAVTFRANEGSVLKPDVWNISYKMTVYSEYEYLPEKVGPGAKEGSGDGSLFLPRCLCISCCGDRWGHPFLPRS